MERCILGSSRYGAWIDVKKITPQSFYISKVIIYFVVSKLNSGTSRIHRLFFVPIYNVYIITKYILHRVGM